MDVILQKFFEPARWQYAIERAVTKGIHKGVLYQLCKAEERVRIYEAIKEGRYAIAPPHIALVPKETPGEWREVYVNEPMDRVLLSIANDLLFELMPLSVHRQCKSYQKGIGCGMVVQEMSRAICHYQRVAGEYRRIGFKSDLSKYFDTVPIGYIDAAFDGVEQAWGKSALIDVLRKYYHCDLYFDLDGRLCHKYQSLKQGCSVASWLSDTMLYHIDSALASMRGHYVRYSDDMLYIGDDAEQAMQTLKEMLKEMQMTLNPKKVEWLDAKHWFRFLGFAIKGEHISLGGRRLKAFQQEIEKRTILKNGQTMRGAINAVNRYLYHGDGRGHSWATQVLPIVNVKEDVLKMSQFVMDAIRACHTGRKKIGGLGYVVTQKTGCVARGRGQHVSANRRKTGDDLSGFLTLQCMQNAIRTSMSLYFTLERQVNPRLKVGEVKADEVVPTSTDDLEAAYAEYKHSIPSERTDHHESRFFALKEEDLYGEDMLYGTDREEAERTLNRVMAGLRLPEGKGWFWQSEHDRDLVVLREWVQPAP